MAVTWPAAWAFYFANEGAVHLAGAWIVYAVGVVVFATEMLGVAAPYGRHTGPAAKWFGPKINAKLAWMVQESGAFFVPAGLLLVADPRCVRSPTNWVLLGMWMVSAPTPAAPRRVAAARAPVPQAHYAQRTFVYAPLMRGGKPMPIGTSILAATYCVYQGWLQGRLWTALEAREPPSGGADAACFGLGCALWLGGFAINVHADSVLRNLRKGPEDRGYYVPRGGAFELVSAANYLGEFVEWCGYALAARRTAATAVAFFTFCNLAPRAKQHHAWCQKKLEGYPAARSAMIPYVW